MELVSCRDTNNKRPTNDQFVMRYPRLFVPLDSEVYSRHSLPARENARLVVCKLAPGPGKLMQSELLCFRSGAKAHVVRLTRSGLLISMYISCILLAAHHDVPEVNDLRLYLGRLKLVCLEGGHLPGPFLQCRAPSCSYTLQEQPP